MNPSFPHEPPATACPALPKLATGTAHRELRILLLEDNTPHAELVEHFLRESGLTFLLSRVETEAAFRVQLEQQVPDLILSDYALPSFDGYTALGIAREKVPDVPFIFVTGTMGEEVAIETLKNGATDYVLKTRLNRLAPAVFRALREAVERRERHLAEEKLRASRDQLRELTTYLQYIREEERTRISREVHDELGQAMTGLKLDLSWLATRLPKNGRTLQQKIKTMTAHIDETIQTVRRIATELRPGILDGLGLVAAIEWQANEFQARTGIPCTVTSTIAETLWAEAFTTPIFRIFQETLTNIIRHAAATAVKVRIAEEAGQLILTVADNGKGVSMEELANTRSIGILGMRERAMLIGGDVTLQSAAGQGTTVTVRAPIPVTPAVPAPEEVLP